MVDGQPAGFVLPVTYDGCSRDGLDEATIYHMGVAPAHRGTGLGRLLLRRTTRVLVDHGVWRIFCDTPANNAPNDPSVRDGRMVSAARSQAADLCNDLHEMTFLTGDMDRLIAFYEQIFDARVTFDRVEEDPPRRRHAFIDHRDQRCLPHERCARFSRCPRRRSGCLRDRRG